MGIQPTNAGIDFQQRISAFMMILMEFDIEIDVVLNLDIKDKIQKLNFEATDEIDDLVITTKTNRKIHMQMKRNISFSDDENSEFYGVCAQFVRQYIKGYLEDSAYILVTRSQASNNITIKLRRILDGIRLADSNNIKNNLNKDEISILEKVEKNIKTEFEKISGKQISNADLKNIICRIYIEVFDIEGGESFEKYIKLILYSKLNVDVDLFWKMLISMAIQYGANRNCLYKEALHKQIKGYIKLHEKTEIFMNLEWEEQGSECEIQKDYVIALGNHEINKKMGIKDEEKNIIFIMELYRFSDAKKKDTLQYISPNIMKWGNGLCFEILFRCSSRQRLKRFMDNGGLEKYINENTEVILIPAKGEYAEEDVESAYKDLIRNAIRSQAECKCINCGKAIFEEETYLIEIDNKECSSKAGMIHKECLRPIDRVLGNAKIPSANRYEYLKNFDINLWIKLIMKGKQVWGNIESLHQPISPLVIDTDEVFTDGKYCIKTILDNGNVRYATNRGVIHRLSKDDAEDFAERLVETYQKAKRENNPICYSSETYVYGQYEQLLVQMDGKEELLECVSAEVAIYNDTIARIYNECETYYAPIIYLSVEGKPVILDKVFPLITNPLVLNIYLDNWEKAGIILDNYEVNIVREDSDFILKILSLISCGIRPIVNMIIGKDKKLIKGCVIQTMKEIELMHYMNEQEQQCKYDND